MLLSMGIRELSLTDGRKLTIKELVFANISKARADEAFQWLRENSMDGIIDKVITVDADLVEKLQEARIAYSQKESVNAMRLKAFAREQLEANPSFPGHLFGVHTVNSAIIK
jgi:hypothetical protein